jgi:hypothetical protein
MKKYFYFYCMVSGRNPYVLVFQKVDQLEAILPLETKFAFDSKPDFEGKVEKHYFDEVTKAFVTKIIKNEKISQRSVSGFKKAMENYGWSLAS